MVKLLKTFGKGILYILTLPFALIVVVIYGVIGIFIFFFECIKAVLLFFTGKTIFDDLPEDIKAKNILKKYSIDNAEEESKVNESAQSEKEEVESYQYIADPFIHINFVPHTSETKIETVEEKEEPIIREEPVQDTEENYTQKIEEIAFAEEEKEEEIIGVYVPKSSQKAIKNDKREDE